MNLKKKPEIDFLARHQIMMGHKVVPKKQRVFESISAEWSYIQCKLTNHLKKVDPKVSKNAKVDPKVSKNAKVTDVLWIFLPPSSIESRIPLLVSMLVACRSSTL